MFRGTSLVPHAVSPALDPPPTRTLPLDEFRYDMGNMQPVQRGYSPADFHTDDVFDLAFHPNDAQIISDTTVCFCLIELI